jgi:hypothetical protein
MADRDRQIHALISEASERGLNRRDVMKRGLALGLSVPAINLAMAHGALAQATPTDSGANYPPSNPAANGPVDVPIVGK